jgi:hypothetical protein
MFVWGLSIGLFVFAGLWILAAVLWLVLVWAWLHNPNKTTQNHKKVVLPS